jgi:phosphohistidine phosphatase
MRVLIVRHAKAEERRLRTRDALRPLTPQGRKDMRKAARALKALVTAIDVLAVSPLVRARQTGEIVQTVFAGPEQLTELAQLVPGTPAKELLAWLTTQPRDATVALVGHEPDLSALVGYLLSGRERSLIELKKGAACLVEFAERPRAGEGRLLWALTPKQLRALAT